MDYEAKNMHEMAALQEVVRELSRLGNPKKAKLRLGAMRADPEHFKELFDEYVRDSPFEGTELNIEDVPVEGLCTCGFSGFVDPPEGGEGHIHFVRCPNCGRVLDITKGNEIEVSAE